MPRKEILQSLKGEDLQGPVKQARIVTYDVVKRDGKYVPGRISDIPVYNRLLTFSPDGLLTKELHFTLNGVETELTHDPPGVFSASRCFNEDGTLRSESKRIFDEKGLNVESYDQVYEASKPTTRYRSVTRYNDAGFAVEYISMVDECQHSRQTYVVDEHGHVLEQNIYDKADALERRIVRTFHPDGKQATEQQFDSQGGKTEDTVYHYDDRGKLIGKTTNGKYEDYTKSDRPAEDYEYDDRGNWIKETTYGYDTRRPDQIAFRDILYYDREGPDELSITDLVPDMANQDNPIPPAPKHSALSLEQWKWVAEGGTREEPFSIGRYYTAGYGVFPSVKEIHSYERDFFSLRRYLISRFGGAEIYSRSVKHGNDWDEQFARFIIAFPRNQYLLEATTIQHYSSHGYEFAEREPDAELGNYVQFGRLNLHAPPSGVAARDEEFEDELEKIIDRFRVRKKIEVPKISMVVTLATSFALQEYKVKDDFKIADLDLHYGANFSKFDAELMEKFRSSTQGLVLFHGEPGTGKTFYVRHLLRKLSETKKVVVYMPPNMVDHLSDPAFLTFISGKMSQFAAAGKSCIMLIEDAEPLLVTRGENERQQGITNLLNMTDGLLNDMLRLQIICTFNVPLQRLDKALLRPGRLIARKEFSPLQEFEANVLAHSLGIKHVFKGPATLGEIYGRLAEKKMLMHEG